MILQTLDRDLSLGDPYGSFLKNYGADPVKWIGAGWLVCLSIVLRATSKCGHQK
jgi:hypothetical protein